MSSQSEINDFLSSVKERFPQTSSASHRMIAYHYVQDNNSMLWADDDGETGVEEKLLNVIHSNNLSNVIILVCRWYGVRHMYARNVIQICIS